MGASLRYFFATDNSPYRQLGMVSQPRKILSSLNGYPRPWIKKRRRRLAAFSQCNQVKCGFPQIDADGCDVHDDDPPS